MQKLLIVIVQMNWNLLYQNHHNHQQRKVCRNIFLIDDYLKIEIQFDQVVNVVQFVNLAQHVIEKILLIVLNIHIQVIVIMQIRNNQLILIIMMIMLLINLNVHLVKHVIDKILNINWISNIKCNIMFFFSFV